MYDTPKPRYRRNLPHWQPPGESIFLTFNLDGSLPRVARERLTATRALLERETARAAEDQGQRRARHNKKLFAVLDQILDKAEHGPLWLKDERIAALVESALLERYHDLYTLWAYVVMANHVHVLLQPKLATTQAMSQAPTFVALKDITKRIKGYTSLEANRLLHRTGQTFWQQESFDHWVRDEGEFFRIVAYIENNPVKAGLVSRPEEWRWSSARERLKRGWVDIRALT
jgi:putative transposase